MHRAVVPRNLLILQPLHGGFHRGRDAIMQEVGAAIGELGDDAVRVDLVLHDDDGAIDGAGRQHSFGDNVDLFLDRRRGIVPAVHVVKDDQVRAELIEARPAHPAIEAERRDVEAVGCPHLLASPALRGPKAVLRRLHPGAQEHVRDGLDVLVRLRLRLGDVQHEVPTRLAVAADIGAAKLRRGRFSAATWPALNPRARLLARFEAADPLPKADMTLGKRRGRVGGKIPGQPFAPRQAINRTPQTHDL